MACLIRDFGKGLALLDGLAVTDEEADERAIADLRAHIEELSGEICKNPHYIAFAAAQKTLNNLMAEVNAEIRFCITGERPQTCTHDCSSCSGCH